MLGVTSSSIFNFPSSIPNVQPQLSIIIPTHKRSEILKECLRCLEEQTIASDIEVIVIHDGEDDKETRSVVEAKSYKLKAISYSAIPKSQQGAARNAGVQKARSSIVLFIGDDIFLRNDACKYHLNIHKNSPTPYTQHPNPIAVLGSTVWDPNIKITPVMEWLTQNGWQFGFPKIEKYAGDFLPNKLQHLFTYTSHISLQTAIAKRIPFRHDTTLYGWEDIEWGMRLRDAGVRVYYEPQALAWHHHVISMEDSLLRMETLGRSASLLHQNVPEFDRVPCGWKRLAYEIFAKLPTMAGQHRAAFLKGIRRAQEGVRD